jgi:hypothetical protein
MASVLCFVCDTCKAAAVYGTVQPDADSLDRLTAIARDQLRRRGWQCDQGGDRCDKCVTPKRGRRPATGETARP